MEPKTNTRKRFNEKYFRIDNLRKENEQLKKERDELRAIIYADKFGVEIMALRMVNAELLEALKEIAKMDNKDFANSFRNVGEAAQQIQHIGKMAKEAIAKAEGKL